MGNKRSILTLFILVFALFAINPVLAHPGRTASDGCHYCRTNCDSWGVVWNARHCHGGIPTPPPPVPATTPTLVEIIEQNRIEEATLYEVTRVVDGDTIEISYSGDLKKLRLIGIDTPETVHPSKPVECFGKEASAKLKELIGDKKVRLEKDSVGDTIDKYGRLLRYVYVGGDATSVNAQMISSGHAYAYTTYPFELSTSFMALETDARENQIGLWAPEACSSEGSEEKQIPLAQVGGATQDGGTDDSSLALTFTVIGLIALFSLWLWRKRKKTATPTTPVA